MGFPFLLVSHYILSVAVSDHLNDFTGAWCLGVGLGDLDGWYGNHTIYLLPAGNFHLHIRFRRVYFIFCPLVYFLLR